jgi:hypothetical protein
VSPFACKPSQPFLCNPWSLLDLFVFVMSLVALGPVGIPVTVLRFMRAFRDVKSTLFQVWSKKNPSVLRLANCEK